MDEKTVLPELNAGNTGHMVKIASAAVLIEVPGLDDYGAAKFGMVGFSDALAYGYLTMMFLN